MVGSYDHGGVLETSKLSSELYNYSTFLPSMPIKIVEKDHTNTSINFAHMMCAQQSARTDQNPVRIGTGTTSTIIVVPDSRSLVDERKPKDKRYDKLYPEKTVWTCLLDTGSDEDLYFHYLKDKVYVAGKDRISPIRWKTSCGTFETAQVGYVELSIPDFNASKVFSISPNIVKVTEEKLKPTYDLIIGVKTLLKWRAVLNFDEETITLDGSTLPMCPPNTEKLMARRAYYQVSNSEFQEPSATLDLQKRAVRILDANYEKADLPAIVRTHSAHLTPVQQAELILLLQEFEELFDGTLGTWQTPPVHLELKEGATPYHGKAFPVPHIHKDTLKKEVERLEEIGVLKRQTESEWASPTFIIPKKQGTVRFISDFREVNKRIKRKPFPIPKISTTIQEQTGFTYATALDLIMGYYNIRLDGDSQKICTIILPWGKYSYMRLPMGVACSPDIFQARMSHLMAALEFVKVYLDDLLLITRGHWSDHLDCLRQVLTRLQKAGLRVNAAKSSFGKDEVEYLGYILCRHGIKPQPQKIQAITALLPPKNVKQLRRFLGMVQYYRDLWQKRSHILTPLTNLVGECGHTKTTKKKGTVKKPWHWDAEHQAAFELVKQKLARDVILAYPDYDEVFEVYTDASTVQLGGVIVQRDRPIAFFSRKLSDPQTRYNITELELLSIIELLKEYRGMLWGQRIVVYTDHRNLIQDALGLSSNRVHRWRLLLEEFGPEIKYIKGIHNTVADAISRLEYNPEQNVQNVHSTNRYHCFAMLLVGYQSCNPVERYAQETDILTCYSDKTTVYSQASTSKDTCVEDNPTKRVRPAQLDDRTSHQGSISQNDQCLSVASHGGVSNTEEYYSFVQSVFDTTNMDDDNIYPVTVTEIASSQRLHKSTMKYLAPKDTDKLDRKFSVKLIDDEQVVVYKDTRLVIPDKDMQRRILDWYHHYLQHPGSRRLYETLRSVMYWYRMKDQVERHVKTCLQCQKGKHKSHKYGHLPAKIAETVPWNSVCVDLIGPYTIKSKDGTILDFMCLTMIDPATGWFEIVELPNTCIEVVRKGEKIIEVIIDKTSAMVSRLFNQTWLCRYPRAKYIIFDNGSEFKLHFRELCDSYSIEQKTTTVKNPQANSILERIHGVIKDMIRTSGLDNMETVTPEDIADVLANVAWAVRSTYHTVLETSPGAAIFGRDMLFNIPLIADWTEIGKRRQALVDKNNDRENARRIDFDYTVGMRVLIKRDGILRKLEDRYDGPYTITQVYTNGTVRVQRGTVNERINIRRLAPYFENDM